MLIDLAYIGAAAVTVAYAAVAVGVALRGRRDVLSVMAADAFAYSLAVAVAAVLAGRALRSDEVSVASIVTVAVPFGVAATAALALGRREAHATKPLLQAVALLLAVVAPFAAGVTGWT